ncbi:MAG: hypothetical protein GOU97_02650 [Nanoarchaeota archaeon]|nr:hypothetical protein [Nanoarchaeota archaeon]
MVRISKDLAVACKIFEITERGERADFNKICSELEGIISKKEIPATLVSLKDWQIMEKLPGEQAGKTMIFYSIKSCSVNMIEETYSMIGGKITSSVVS